MRNTTILLAVVAVLALAVPAYGGWVGWDGTDGNWNVPENWSTDRVPIDDATYDDDPWIAGGNTAEITTDVGAVRACQVGNGTAGHVKMTNAAAALTINNGLTIKDGGTFTQSAGTVTISSGNSFIGGSDAGDYGTYEISGGTLNTKWLYVGGSSGGDSYGTFRVKGTGAAGVNCTGYYQSYDDGNNGKTEMVLNASGEVDKIDVTGSAILRGKLYIDTAEFGYTPSETDDPITILTVTGSVTYGNLVLVDADGNATGDWEFLESGDTGYDAKAIKVQYVPEPATLALLGIGGIGVLLRRRKSRA